MQLWSKLSFITTCKGKCPEKILLFYLQLWESWAEREADYTYIILYMIKDSLQDCANVVLVCMKHIWDVWILKHTRVHQGLASGSLLTVFSD